MTCVVFSQPMLFPWVGLLEQVRHADVFVHYDDAAYSRGGVFNRVQVKTAHGVRWMTVPVRIPYRGAPFVDIAFDDRRPWRSKHRAMLAQSLAGAPFVDDALALFDAVDPSDNLADYTIASVECLAAYFGLRTRFVRSSALGLRGRSSERVLRTVQAFAGTRYVTGQGAARYLDHARFDEAGVAVEYMAYRRSPYPQRHGPFDPHVSALDLVAHLGREGAQLIHSPTTPWREFVHADLSPAALDDAA